MNPAGPDTIMEAIIPYRGFLESFIALNRIASIVEIDCGDWQHTRFTLPDAVTYLGLDRSAAVVERNNARFASATHRFAVMPADADDIPVAQLLLMKDALQHLGNDSIRALCDTLFPRFAHCLLTDSYRKLDTPQNTDIPDGGFRCLDLSAAPFHLDGAFVLEFPGENWELKRAFLHRPAAAHHAVIEADIVMLQTADPVVYRDMLDLTGAVNIEYCQRNAIAYESVLGVKSGVSPWMSTYNRIFMLDDLVRRGFRGWVIYADADAYVGNFTFDIRAYLAANRRFCLIGATGGTDEPWNLNAGILFINLGDPVGRAFAADWLKRFCATIPATTLASPDTRWGSVPSDQDLMYECIREVPGLVAKTKREEGRVFNYDDGAFMKQAIRAGYVDLARRIEAIRLATTAVLAANPRPVPPPAPAPLSAAELAALALLGQSQRLLAEGQVEPAILAAEQAVVAAPEHATCAVHLAYLMVAHRPLPEAEAACQRALAIAPEDAGALNAFSMCCARANRLQEAVAAARQSVQLRPGNPHFHGNLGNLLRRIGDMHGAEEAYRGAIACAPGVATPYRDLSLLYAEYGLWHDALVTARQAAELAPHDQAIASHLASLLAR